MKDRLLLIAVVVFSAAVSCRPNQPAPSQASAPAAPSGAHAAVVLPDKSVIEIELATDDATRQQGLMDRESIDPGKGMLFIFPMSGEYPFWMKNTMVPLDMIWIDEARTVVHIASGVPPCTADPCPSYPPGKMAKYVLELKAGEAAAHHLKDGDVVEMRNLEGVQVR
jgi:Uncharacterized conserved protein